MDEPMDSRLIEHLQLVIEANKTTNITRITSFEEAMVLHIEDSLAALEEIDAAPDGMLADIGSGAGYPGIPLAIRTGRQTVLVESIKKKAHILRGMVEALQLENTVQVYSGRAEELAKERPAEFAVVTARAVAKLGVLMELASPLLVQGGRLVCYKAHVDSDELNHALELQERLGLRHATTWEFVLSDESTYRQIIVFEKAEVARIKLPRNVGMAQKKPL